MQAWLIQNWFKVSIIFCLFLIAGGLYLRPQTNIPNNNRETLAQQKTCFEDAEKVHDDYVAKYYGDTFLLDPIYHYNAKLNECFYAQSYTSPSSIAGSGGAYDAFIINVYDNSPVIEYEEVDGKVITTPKEIFQQKYRELFETDTDFTLITAN